MIKALVEKRIAAPADAVWAYAGPFGSLADWHPMVPTLQLSADGLTREIPAPRTNAIEILDPSATTAHSYTYTVPQSPMPLKNYRATLGVRPDGDDACTIYYESTCEADGIPDETLKSMLEGFFGAGFDALAGHFAS